MNEMQPSRKIVMATVVVVVVVLVVFVVVDMAHVSNGKEKTPKTARMKNVYVVLYE